MNSKTPADPGLAGDPEHESRVPHEEPISPEDRLVLTGNRAVDLCTEVELWRLARGIGFESWNYCIVFENGNPHFRAIGVLKLVYRMHLAFESSVGWTKPFKGAKLHLTYAMIAAKLNLTQRAARAAVGELSKLGLLHKDFVGGSRPHLTPDPVRVAAITFPVETVADRYIQTHPLFQIYDTALHHLRCKRALKEGGVMGTTPINLIKPRARRRIEEQAGLPDGDPRLQGDAEPGDVPYHPSHRTLEEEDRQRAMPRPTRRPIGSEDHGGQDVTVGQEPGSGDRMERGPKQVGERPNSSRRVGTLDPVDALSALYVGSEIPGAEGLDEDELERMAAAYPHRERPHPLEEAYRAHRIVLDRHRENPYRAGGIGVDGATEAYGVREAVYERSVKRLEDALIERYRSKRKEHPMNAALTSVVAHFIYRFQGAVDPERVGRAVNILVGKLRDQKLADVAARALGVPEPFDYDSDTDRSLLKVDVQAEMDELSDLWKTDVALQREKEEWAEERVRELVRLTFMREYEVEEDVEHLQRFYRSGKERRDIWHPLRHEYLDPEILHVWSHLGLRQLGHPNGTVHYSERQTKP